MNKKRLFGLGVIGLAAVALLAGCRANSSSSTGKAKTDLKVALVTDTGGVNDKSFNQGAWEGLQAWGKTENLSKGNGINYFQSNSEADYANNFTSAISGGYKLVFGIGFSLQTATQQAAKANPNTKFAIIDSTITGSNTVSATFADNEAAYLAGVAAAKTTKTKHVGFIGGMDSDVITRFRVGFEAGVKSVDPSITIDSQLANSFTDAGKGKTLAQSMYAAGADVIYQAAGGVGAGVFAQAKVVNEGKNEADKVWVIGVDRDQKDEGSYTSKDNKSSNFVLASTLKGVGTVVKDVSQKTVDGKFPSGETLIYNLKNSGVDLTTTSLDSAAKDAVASAKADIVSGKVVVPEK
ncbi:MAG: BMP family protein [Streptococcaceae bacterium]|jgi:basic membrane protein A|nr:BMP family protein [Streptococcaceae bacterium]